MIVCHHKVNQPASIDMLFTLDLGMETRSLSDLCAQK